MREKSSLSCKRQFKNIKNSDSFKEVIKQETNPRRKSRSPILQSRHNSLMFEMPSHNQSFDGLKIGLKDKSTEK